MARRGSSTTSTDRTRRSRRYLAKVIPARLGNLPAAHAPDVDMNEVGVGIVADTAASERQRGVPDTGSRNAGQANVDGLGLHMHAMQGDAGRMGPQELVAPRRTIAADDVDFGVRMAGGGDQIGEEIEQAGIEAANVAGPMIAKEVIQPR